MWIHRYQKPRICEIRKFRVPPVNHFSSPYSKLCNSKHSACFAFSEEEYGQNGCLEGDIEKQGLIFEDFFSRFWNQKKPFIKQDFTKGKGKINMTLAGLQLNVLVSTDFLTAMGKVLKQEPLEIMADFVMKCEDLTFKV